MYISQKHNNIYELFIYMDYFRGKSFRTSVFGQRIMNSYITRTCCIVKRNMMLKIK